MPPEVLEFVRGFTGRALEALYRDASAAGGASGIKDTKDQIGVHRFALYDAMEELFGPENTPLAGPAAKTDAAAPIQVPPERAWHSSGTDTPRCEPVPAASASGGVAGDAVEAVGAVKGAVEEAAENFEVAKDFVGDVTELVAATGKGADFLEKVGSIAAPVAGFVTSVMESAPWLGPAVKVCAKLVAGVQAVHAAKGSCLELAEIARTVASTLDKHKSKIKQGAKTSQQVDSLKGALEEGVELVTKFSKRSFLVKLYFCRRTEEEFQEVTTNILRQVDLMQFDVIVDVSDAVNDVSAGVQEVKQVVAAIESKMSTGGMFRNDEDEALRRKIEDLGGMSAVLSSDDALGDVINSMGAQGQVVAGLTREVAASMEQLMEFHRKGTHSVIRNDELRVFWSEHIKGNEVDTRTFVTQLAAWLRGVSFEQELATQVDANTDKLIVELNLVDDVSIATFKVNPSLVDSVFPANKTVAARLQEMLGSGVTYCTVPDLPDPLQQREDDVETVVAALDEKPVAVVHGSPGSGRRVLAHIIAREVMKDHPAGLLHVDLKETWRSEEDIVKEVGLQLGRDWKQARDMTDFLEATTRVHRGSVLLVITGVTSELWAQARRGGGRGLRPLVTGLLQRLKEGSLQVLGQRQGLSLVVTSEAELDVAALEEDIKKAVRHISIKPLDERGLAKLRTQTRRRAPSSSGIAHDGGLADDLREAMVGLGVFPGSFNLEAATAVLDRLDAAPLLRKLVDAGYLQLWRESGRWELGEEGRRMAETLASGDRTSLARRAERRFVDYVEKLTERLKRWAQGSEQLQARMIFMRERHNILRAAEVCSDDDFALLGHVGFLLQRDDDMNGAVALYQRALRGCERNHGDESTAAASILNALGNVMQDQNKLDEAMRLCERALRIREQAYGPEHTDVAATLGNMANVMRQQGRPDDAMRLYERALQIDEQVYGPEHSEVAKTLVNMGGAMHEQDKLDDAMRLRDKLDEAMRLYERALQIQEQVYGPEHSALAVTLNNLANVMGDQNKLDEAMRLYERVLRIQEKVYGPDDTKVAKTLYNMATVMGDQKKLDDAMRLYERALRIKEQVYGPEHSEVAATLHNMATVMGDQNKLDDAMRLYERALRIQEQVYGPEHSAVAVTLNKLGAVMWDQNKLDEAMRLYERVLRIREQAYGPEHSEVAKTLNNLANVMRQQGRPDEAMRLYERALRIDEQVYGPEHSEVAATLVNMGLVMGDQNKLDEAMRLYERALQIQEQVYGPEHRQVAVTLFSMADVTRQQNKLDEAMRLYERVLQIEEVYGPEHSLVAVTLGNMDDIRKELDALGRQ
ncbi:unnamed protein product [Pedinophyceae sp. YPF-701]|nr:unnamed protein product [Pedinophyceae sp. YPF-701]